MPGTYYDPTLSYAGGGLDRETGQNMPAALWQRMMDMLEFITGGSETWTDFTPTLTQSGAVTITVTRARYQIIGKIAHVQIKLDVTGSGTGNNNIVIGAIPAAIAPVFFGSSSGQIAGVGVVADVSASLQWGATAEALSASTIAFQGFGVAGRVGVTPNFALASGDVVALNGFWEIA